MTILKRVGFGIVLWAIPFSASIPLLSLNESDPLAFKALMVLIGTTTGSVLAAYYFLTVERDYVQEGILLGGTWIGVNWLLDIVALLPFTHQTIAQYFAQIGIEYIGMLAPTVAIGYVLQRKVVNT